MRGRKPCPLSIGSHDRTILQEVARSKTLPSFPVRRTRTVLAIAAGERTSPLTSPVGVRRRHRASHVPTLRRHGGMGPSRTASATGPPGPDFPPSSGPRSSHSPAWSRSPGACTSPTGRVRIWPGEPSPTELSSRSAPGPSAGSSTGWICNRTAPATGGRPAATPGSRPALRRSSGATGTPSGWPGGATGSSAPMRSPTSRSSNGSRSAGPSLARSSSKSSTTLATAPSISWPSWSFTPAACGPSSLSKTTPRTTSPLWKRSAADIAACAVST